MASFPRLFHLLPHALLTLALGAASAEPLTMYLDPVPGLLISRDNGATIEGPGADAMRKVAAYAGLEFQFVLAPTARSLVIVADGQRACAAAIVRTAAREALYKWAGVLARARMVVYARADDAFSVLQPADMQRHVIGALRNSVAALWLKEQGLNSYEVTDQSASLRMLQMRRLDLWASSELAAQYVIKEVGGVPPRIVYVIRTDDANIACSRQVPDETMVRLNQALARLRLEGGLVAFGVK